VLERRRGVQQPAPLPPQQVISPPATPVKTPKSKSRNNSSASLSSQKGRKKLMGTSTPPSSKSISKAKVGRKASIDHGVPPLPQPTAQHPGALIPGPNGMMYAPIGYYPPPSPEQHARVQPGATRPRSRSTSKHSRRESTPPEQLYAAYPPRYYPPPAGMRPESSGSNRSAQEDLDYYPPPQAGRMRSASNAHQYRLPDDGYAAGPSMPATQGRRSVGGSPDGVSYSSLRRVPPSSSPLAPRYADPAGLGRKGSGLSQEVESSSSSSGDDQGVQVEVLPEAQGGGYSVNRTTAAASRSVNEGRRRKIRR